MNSKYAIALVTTFAVASAGIAFANDIYRYTDEDGTVHYVDRPTGAATEERLAITSRPTDPSKVQARVDTRLKAKAERKEAEEAAEPAGPTEEELQAQARERQQKCDTYKARLQKFLTSRRLYREDESGERVYLDESETLAARDRVQSQVEEYCGS